MTYLESHLEDQTFLPCQLEAALGTIFFAGLLPADPIQSGKPLLAALYSLPLAAITFLSLCRVGSFLHLISVYVRLFLSGLFSYIAIFDPPNPLGKVDKAIVWIWTDPLCWMVELAIFFHFDNPIFPVIWSVRRATIAGCFLTIGLDGKFDRKFDEMKVWTILMAFIMILQIMVNLSEEDHYVTLGTVLLLLINHMLGNKEAESNASEVFQNNFMIPFIIVKLVRVFKRK